MRIDLRPVHYFPLIILVYLVSFFYYRSWERQIVYGGDTWGYYAYLPALFIYHDLDHLKDTFAKSVEYGHPVNPHVDNPLGTGVPQHIGDGKQIIKYTSGIAIMLSPFFLLAHVMAGWLGYPQDGFSFPYLFLANIATLVYVIAGLYILYFFLKKIFSKNITALCILAIALATNLYFFSVYLCPMSHGYLFFWYSILLIAVHQWHKKPGFKSAVMIGLSCGFIAISRPSDAIVVLIPLLYGIGSMEDFRNKIQLVRKNMGHLAATITAFIIPILPQIIYWKSISGKWIFYSYGEEGFDFSNPHILDGLFSYTNGWLVYVPVMLFSVLGFVFLLKNKKWRLPILVFFFLHVYIIYSWWCWYYINGIGSRPMVQIYAVLAIPLGYMFVFLTKRVWTRIALAVLLVFFCVLNIFQTWQLSNGIIWPAAGSKGYYWETFGQTEITPEAIIAFDTHRTQPDSSDMEFVQTLYVNDFEDSLDVYYTRSRVKSGNFSYALQGDKNESPKYSSTLEAAGVRPGEWLRFSAWCYSWKKEYDWYRMNLMVVRFKQNGKVVRQVQMRIENKIAENNPSLWGGKVLQWGEVAYFVKVPEKMKKEDEIEAYIWRETTNVPVYIDDMQVKLFRKK